MLIVCASHVGIDAQGNVGKLNRVGMDSDSSACGAAIAAYKFCEKNSEPGLLAKICDGDDSVYPGFLDPLDSQQNYIQKASFHSDRLPIPMHPRANTSRRAVCRQQIQRDTTCAQPDGDARRQVRGADPGGPREDLPRRRPLPVFILNGVQINFEGEGVGEDYFCPLAFVLRDTHEEVHDLLPALRELRDADLAHDMAILDFWRKDLERRPGANIVDSIASALKLR